MNEFSKEEIEWVKVTVVPNGAKSGAGPTATRAPRRKKPLKKAPPSPDPTGGE
jgi:hypothetical protein